MRTYIQVDIFNDNKKVGQNPKKAFINLDSIESIEQDDHFEDVIRVHTKSKSYMVKCNIVEFMKDSIGLNLVQK